MYFLGMAMSIIELSNTKIRIRLLGKLFFMKIMIKFSGK